VACIKPAFDKLRTKGALHLRRGIGASRWAAQCALILSWSKDA
jgi:hypothetical protein